MKQLSSGVLSLLLLVCSLGAQGTPVGFAETFALAKDRGKVLEQLIPGSKDYYYYSCLHRQHQGKYGDVPGLLRAWAERHGRTQRLQEIENRQALLTYSEDPRATFSALKAGLRLRFEHTRPSVEPQRKLATRLDPATISPTAFTRQALSRHPRSLHGFRDTAFAGLAVGDLNDRLLAQLLQRLRRPDLPNLPALVVRHLQTRRGGGFGSMPIHRRLLLGQLDECLRLRPSLLQERNFIDVYLKRLRPGVEAAWRSDPNEEAAYLQRLYGFVQRLAPAHNSLKAHVIYHLLRNDLARGKPDRQRLLGYLQLPRNAHYVVHKLRRDRHAANLNHGFATGLVQVGSDERLVRAYLQHFFKSEDSYEAYGRFIQTNYLRRLFAETKILAGVGDMERWYSLLNDPNYYQNLKDRVEIQFPASQRQFFGANEDVSIELDLKNVPTLLVRVFEIDTFNVYSRTKREVPSTLRTDGLVPNQEQTHAIEANSLRRVRRRFDLPSLKQPGVYIVEFLGNGIASRAVIHKGQLRHAERLGAAGHVLTVFDAAGKLVKDASVWMTGRNYEADEAGEIVLPYSTKPGKKPIVLRRGRQASLAKLQHSGESYRLQASAHVERETLRAGGQARLLVRPVLLLNGERVDLSVIKEPMLSVRTTDVHGVASSMQLRGLNIVDNKEFSRRIEVPADLVELSVQLRGKVRNLSQGKDETLVSPAVRFPINQIDKTAQTHSPLLQRTPAGYVLELRGKNGEQKPDRAVALAFEHRDFVDPMQVTLKSDKVGKVHLGQLPQILALRVQGLAGQAGVWRLQSQRRTYPRYLHGVVGETLRVPYQGSATQLSRDLAVLYEMRAGEPAVDASAKLALADGYLQLRDLAAGDYRLYLPAVGRQVSVRVTGGERRGDWLVGAHRLLDHQDGNRLHITKTQIVDAALQINLAGASKAARVHVFATRYLPPFHPFEDLRALVPAGSYESVTPAVESRFATGRALSGEHRYVLERRFAKKFPGNMLARPPVLLNAWTPTDDMTRWNSAVGLGGGAGGKFGGRRGGRSRRGSDRDGKDRGLRGVHPAIFANLDFLPDAPKLHTNLRPDAAGVVRIALQDLGAGGLIHVVAVDDVSTVYESLTRAAKGYTPRNRRLRHPLPADGHFRESRDIEFLAAGAKTLVQGANTAQAETYDSLGSVFDFMSTVSQNPELAKFGFLIAWPSLDAKKKSELYSDHACHELNFFLRRKDPEFFAKTVKPYLANKAQPMFLDLWLLDKDLSRYKDPHAFAQLNVVEKILLARRLGGDVGKAMIRHVKEHLASKATDPARQDRLFEAALKGPALATSSAVSDMLRELQSHADPKSEGLRRAPAPSKRAKRKAGRNADKAMPEESPADVAEEVEEEEEVEDADDESSPPTVQPPAAASRSASKSRRKDLQRRQNQRRLYRAPKETRPYYEHYYWHVPVKSQTAQMIRVNQFWRDFAEAPSGQPFFSKAFVETASGSVAEMLMTLAVLDLPFEAGKHLVRVDDNKMEIEAKTSMLLVRKELVAAAVEKDAAPILVSQNLFRLDEPYRQVAGERRDAYITEEFLVDVAYGCRVVATNPTSAPRNIELLLQIPQGAVPVQSGFRTRGMRLRLKPFATSSVQYAFYFPKPGSMSHYPVHVTSNGKIVASAQPMALNVVSKPSRVDKTSWRHVAQHGSGEEVLQYLDTHNLFLIDLGQIAWRMRDRDFFAAVIQRLQMRQVYNNTLWSYGVFHQDEVVVQQFLRHQERFLRTLGVALQSPLLNIDPFSSGLYEHVEFRPLINRRAHRWGDERRILNRGVAQQYRSFLRVQCQKAKLDDADWLAATYYLLLQDRVEPALQAFASVDRQRLASKLQYDYTKAYLGFYTGDLASSKAVAGGYKEHPVPRWRQRFATVLAHLQQVDGAAPSKSDAAAGDTEELVSKDPALEMQVDGAKVLLRYQNVSTVEISFYRMDVELLFSSRPFRRQDAGAFAFFRPNHAQTLQLPTDKSEFVLAIPDALHNANLLIEVRGAGLARQQTVYRSSLAVQVAENYGHLTVRDGNSAKPMPKTYVKVFARLSNGRVHFHKDGYTDLRGRFDYASVSGKETESATRYAVLVWSEENGAMIRELTPPAR